MSKEAQAVLDSALKLSDDERDEIIAGLIDSLDDEGTAFDQTEFHQELPLNNVKCNHEICPFISE